MGNGKVNFAIPIWRRDDISFIAHLHTISQLFVVQWRIELLIDR